jgi:hypothetical protein
MKAISVFRCDSCGEIHDEEYQAELCCPPQVTYMYKCSVCESVGMDGNKIQMCCTDTNKELTKSELESLGQQRLDMQ